jgi:hypothetical protein
MQVDNWKDKGMPVRFGETSTRERGNGDSCEGARTRLKMLSADLPSKSVTPGMRRWAVECIAAVGCFLANISCHAIWEIWNIASTISNRVPFAIYVHAVKAALPLGRLIGIAGMSIFAGLLIGLGIGRVWIHRRRAAAVFVAGALVSVGGFILLSSLKDLHPTSTTLWAVMLAYSLGMPWILGRFLSGSVRRDGGSGEERGTRVN